MIRSSTMRFTDSRFNHVAELEFINILISLYEMAPAMKVLIIIFCFTVVSALPREMSFGICAEMCTPGSCPAGQSCRSNGCGHTCQPNLHIDCPLVLCDLYCKNGFATGKNGCPVCRCNSNTLPNILI